MYDIRWICQNCGECSGFFAEDKCKICGWVRPMQVTKSTGSQENE